MAGSFEVKEGPSVLEWVGDGDVGTVPTVAAIVGDVGVAAVVGVEAVRHRDGLPGGDLFAVPASHGPPSEPAGTPILR